MDSFEGDQSVNKVIENKSYDDDFLLCKEEMHGKRHYQELLSGFQEDSDVVHDDLEISDSDDEIKERNVNESEKLGHLNTTENEEDDQDGLWF